MDSKSVTLHRIVTGVDFQEESNDVLRWTLGHFAPEAAHHLLNVLDVPDLPGPLRSLAGNREQLVRSAREGAEKRLREMADLVPRARATPHVSEGRPSAEILRLSDEVEADLIVVGEGGPARGIGALLGSTAERVLFDARVPVLVARKMPEGPPLRLFAAVDPAEVTTEILAWAGALMDRFDATLTVMNVVNRVFLLDELTGLPSGSAFQTLEAESVDAMRAWLEREVEQAGLPRSRVELDVRVGDPAYEIISEAARRGQDLILMGTKGGDIARTPLIGRIVNKVVRSAPVSVLVVTRRDEIASGS